MRETPLFQTNFCHRFSHPFLCQSSERSCFLPLQPVSYTPLQRRYNKLLFSSLQQLFWVVCEVHLALPRAHACRTHAFCTVVPPAALLSARPESSLYQHWVTTGLVQTTIYILVIIFPCSLATVKYGSINSEKHTAPPLTRTRARHTAHHDRKCLLYTRTRVGRLEAVES